MHRQLLNSTIHVLQRDAATLEPLVARDTGLQIPNFPDTVNALDRLSSKSDSYWNIC